MINVKDRTSPQYKELGYNRISLYSLNRNKILIMDRSSKCIFKKEIITGDLSDIIKQIIKSNHDIVDRVSMLSQIELDILAELLILCQLRNLLDTFNLQLPKSEIKKDYIINRFNTLKEKVRLLEITEDELSEYKEILDCLRERDLIGNLEFKKLSKSLS